MYNIYLYSYWPKPFTRNKKFTIHPLDDPGKEKYYSEQSHCTYYVKRTHPFVFKSILGVDYETLVGQQKEDIALMNKLKSSSEKESVKNNEMESKKDNDSQIDEHINEFQDNEKKDIIKNSNLNNSFKNDIMF